MNSFRHYNCLQFLFLLLSIAVFTSCSGEGSGNIFDDPPDCFYDSLFGCGTFDIPGDSSYYMYERFAKKASTAGTSSSDFSGSWKGILRRKSSSCRFATPQKLNSNYSVKQLNRRVTIKLPGSTFAPYSLRGPVTAKGWQASTFGVASFCSFSANSKFESSGKKKGNLNLDLKITCPLRPACTLSYVGSVRK